MTAVLIPTANEAEWLAARRTGITASEIPVVLGLSSFSSPYKLFHQKTGDLPADDDSDRLGLGRHLEPYIAGRFAALHPEFHVHGDGSALFAHPDRRWQMATPDRFVFGSANELFELFEPLAVLECKSWGTFDGWGDDGGDEIPVAIRAQALWQADVMGVGTAYVACVFLPGAQMRVYEIAADDDRGRADLKLMREEARDFLDRIDLGDPPDVDWRPATADALKRLHPDVEDREVPISVQLAGWYRAACRNHKEWERKKKLYENRIREQLGNARRAVIAGPAAEPVARRDVYDVKAHHRKASHVDKLVAIPPKGAGQ